MIFGKKNTVPNASGEMPFLGHLEALRWHLIRSVGVVVLFSVIAFFYKEILFDGIILAPKKPDFITFRALCKASRMLHLDLCIQSAPFKIINNELSGQFTLHMWVAFIAGLVVGLPYFFYELWRFIRPALQEKERRYTTGVVFFTSCLFFLGVLFGYFIITPMSVNFLGSYQVSEQVENFINLDSYISTVTILTLATGVVFELPMVIYFLSKVGVISPQFMRKYRKHAFVLNLIIAAIITPTPDITGQLMVALPLVFLYEISIFVSAAVIRNKEKETRF